MKTYKIEDRATITCSCGETVEFKPGEVFKFCSSCGEEHNKLLKGVSLFNYSSVMAGELKKKIADSGPWYYETTGKNAAPYKIVKKIKKVEIDDVSGYADSPKCFVKLKYHVTSMEVNYDADGNVTYFNATYSNFGTARVEYSDRDMYKLSNDKLNEEIKKKAKDLFFEEITKDEYTEKLDKIMNSSVWEIIDDCTKIVEEEMDRIKKIKERKAKRSNNAK
jgi:hypothetical protein